MPVIFFGHGNPMNAVLTNAFTEGWTAIGAGVPRPKAVLAVSAHWYVPATAVTAAAKPRTIHDFGGFPREPAVREALRPAQRRLHGPASCTGTAISVPNSGLRGPAWRLITS